MITVLLLRFLKFKRYVISKVNRAVVFLHLKRFFVWIKKHQKMTAWGTGVIALFNLHIVRYENEELKNKVTEQETEIVVLKEAMNSTTTTMNNLDVPWYRKMKMKDRWVFRINGMNKGYEIYYNCDRFSLLGKSNEEIAPGAIGKGWTTTDSLVLARWAPVDTLEFSKINDSVTIPVYSHKFPGLDGLDSLVYGISIPIINFKMVMDQDGVIQSIEVYEDTEKILDIEKDSLRSIN
tara:strand:- start:53914 stop:54621 length:708 start_codon:yes stop_codon:yes gene_type:complete